MIYIKNDEEISLMKKAGKIVGDTLKIVESIIKEGVTTNYLDSNPKPNHHLRDIMVFHQHYVYQ